MAELLMILRDDLPRALHPCLHGIVAVLEHVEYARSAETLRRAGQIYASLHYGRMEDIGARSLHAWLDDFILRIGDLGAKPSPNCRIRAGFAACCGTPTPSLRRRPPR